MTEPKYVRVYYAMLDDPKFAEIYDDDAAFATWVRLLMAADAIWPAPATVPRTTDDEQLKKLAKAGLVDLRPRDQFRIHGLDDERRRRSAGARHAAAVRWHGGSNADSMPRRDETSKSETKDEQASRRATDREEHERTMEHLHDLNYRAEQRKTSKGARTE